MLPENPYIGDIKTAACAGSRELDTAELRLGRLARLREEMARFDMGACVLLDPINIRYACGARNMQIFMSRNPARYLFVAQNGPVILFEFPGAYHLAEGLETINEIRPAVTVSAVAADMHIDQRARDWGRELAQLTRDYDTGRRIGIERCYYYAGRALEAEGLQMADAQQPVERARSKKTPEELACILASVSATEKGVNRLEKAIRPGVSELDVWAHLSSANIEQDGDYIETRLFNSGPRTNPWFQEASPRLMQAGELIALDTDVVGPYGYYTDFSRTFLCGDVTPTEEQCTLYKLAYEQIQHNTDLLKPGRSFREIAEQAWPIPEAYRSNRYFVLAHGCGMTGEYPYLLHGEDFDQGYDGLIEPGMTLCVESYIGHERGGEGVKLEDQFLITEDGAEPLSCYPYDDRLLG